jgi:hypothetical protein
MRTFFSFSVIALVLLVAGIASSHERKEIAGMSIVFGGSPEPMLDNEVILLEWRITDLKTEEGVANLQDVSVMVKFDGKEFGPFETRSAFRNAGMYRTRHIFTNSGEGEATLTFKKEGEDMVHSLTLTFRIGSRGDIEIP